MSVPVPNRKDLAQGIFALSTILAQVSDAKVALLAELAPERGEALWVRFTSWRRRTPEGHAFPEWIASLFSSNMAQALYPVGCTLDQQTQTMLLSLVRSAINPKSNSLNDDDLLNAHFGVEPQYGRVRKEVCRGCLKTKCRHFLR